jgi:hypothetical protein
MQRKKTSKNHFCEHYAANSLFYKNPSVLLTFGHFSGQKKCPFLKNFPTYFLIFFCLKNFHEYSYKNTNHVCSQYNIYIKLKKIHISKEVVHKPWNAVFAWSPCKLRFI